MRLLFLSILVSVSCWLSKNNLDAFLYPPLCSGTFLSGYTIISVLKRLKNSLVKPSELDTFVGASSFKKFFP